MLRPGDKLTDHCLNDSNVSIKNPSKSSSEQRNPEVCCKTDNKKGKKGAGTAEKQDRFSAYPIGDATPKHAGTSLGQGEGRNEDASIESGIALVAKMEAEDELPGIGKD